MSPSQLNYLREQMCLTRTNRRILLIKNQKVIERLRIEAKEKAANAASLEAKIALLRCDISRAEMEGFSKATNPRNLENTSDIQANIYMPKQMCIYTKERQIIINLLRNVCFFRKNPPKRPQQEMEESMMELFSKLSREKKEMVQKLEMRLRASELRILKLEETRANREKKLSALREALNRTRNNIACPSRMLNIEVENLRRRREKCRMEVEYHEHKKSDATRRLKLIKVDLSFLTRHFKVSTDDKKNSKHLDQLWKLIVEFEKANYKFEQHAMVMNSFSRHTLKLFRDGIQDDVDDHHRIAKENTILMIKMEKDIKHLTDKSSLHFSYEKDMVRAYSSFFNQTKNNLRLGEEIIKMCTYHGEQQWMNGAYQNHSQGDLLVNFHGGFLQVLSTIRDAGNFMQQHLPRLRKKVIKQNALEAKVHRQEVTMYALQLDFDYDRECMKQKLKVIQEKMNRLEERVKKLTCHTVRNMKRFRELKESVQMCAAREKDLVKELQQVTKIVSNSPWMIMESKNCIDKIQENRVARKSRELKEISLNIMPGYFHDRNSLVAIVA